MGTANLGKTARNQQKTTFFLVSEIEFDEEALVLSCTS